MNELDKRIPGGRPALLDTDSLRKLHQRYLNGERLVDLVEETPYKSLDAAFRRLGLPALGLAGPRAKIGLDDPRAVKALALWDAGTTAKAAGEEVGISRSVMTRLLHISGRNGQRHGELHPSWRGGRSLMERGYVRVWVHPDDPLAGMRRKDGTSMEHRLAMARHLGRVLGSHETVHHINGDKTDNRIDNLELRNGHHGPGQAMRCCDCGSRRVEFVTLEEAA